MKIANMSNKPNKLLFPCKGTPGMPHHITFFFFLNVRGWFSSCTRVSVWDQNPDFQINHGFKFMGFAYFGVLIYTNLFLWLSNDVTLLFY